MAAATQRARPNNTGTAPSDQTAPTRAARQARESGDGGGDDATDGKNAFKPRSIRRKQTRIPEPRIMYAAAASAPSPRASNHGVKCMTNRDAIEAAGGYGPPGGGGYGGPPPGGFGGPPGGPPPGGYGGPPGFGPPPGGYGPPPGGQFGPPGGPLGQPSTHPLAIISLV